MIITKEHKIKFLQSEFISFDGDDENYSCLTRQRFKKDLLNLKDIFYFDLHYQGSYRGTMVSDNYIYNKKWYPEFNKVPHIISFMEDLMTWAKTEESAELRSLLEFYS